MRILDRLKKTVWWAAALHFHTAAHQLSLHIAAGLGLAENESIGIFQPFGGFADDTPIETSYVTLSRGAGHWL